MLEYFGRNTFIMNILQTWTTRKLLNTRYLRAGNRGGTPHRKTPDPWDSRAGAEAKNRRR